MVSDREKIISTLGRLPEKCERNIIFLEKTDSGNFITQTVEYNTEKNERVRAFLLIPKNAEINIENNGKIPAIVAAHQHAGQYHLGKSEPAGLSEDPMYHYGKELAERGFIVICPDHLGFEERLPPQSELDKRGIDGSLNERELFCHAIMRGCTLQGKYVSDLSAAVDVLCSLEYIDSQRIGVIGHSLGGQEALWLTFYDSRIKAGVSSCGFATVQSVFEHHIPHNFAMFTFGGLNAGDTPAILREIGRAGKSFMFTNGTEDRIFPMNGVQELLKIQNNFSDRKKFKSCIFEGGHSFPENLRREAYEFLEENVMEICPCDNKY